MTKKQRKALEEYFMQPSELHLDFSHRLLKPIMNGKKQICPAGTPCHIFDIQGYEARVSIPHPLAKGVGVGELPMYDVPTSYLPKDVQEYIDKRDAVGFFEGIFRVIGIWAK